MKKWLIRIVLAVVLLVVVALAVVFFSLNSIIKKSVETVGPQVTRVPVTLESADVSPFSGSGRLTKFVVGNPNGYKSAFSISVGDMKVAVKPMSVFSDTIVVDEINVQSPEITVEANVNGSNLLDIFNNIKGTNKQQKADAPAPASKGPGKKICVKEFVVDGGKMHISISAAGLTESATVDLAPIHLQNIGTESAGVTAEEFARQVGEPLIASAEKAAKELAANTTRDFKELTKGGTNKVDSVLKGIGGLLGK